MNGFLGSALGGSIGVAFQSQNAQGYGDKQTSMQQQSLNRLRVHSENIKPKNQKKEKLTIDDITYKPGLGVFGKYFKEVKLWHT
ncbi:MAG: hypothetical protein GY714_18010 [Desulfobacterales bacterium]|nr:hypothetical protein [Desulfobacterales bacterium]